jgi:tetratricopeptide (TPR) repeat protein
MQPALKNDKALFLEEARLLGLAGDLEPAAKVLAKARESFADDPDVLAESGLLTVLASEAPQPGGLDQIRRAIAQRPQDAGYHYDLAQALDHAKQRAEALREYRRTAELPAGPDIWSQRVRNGALADMLQVFKTLPEEKCAAPDALPDMPLDERIRMLEFFRANSSSTDRAVPACLGALYHAVGEQAKARAQLQQSLGDDTGDWKYYLPRLRLLTEILEQERPVDRPALDQARGILDQAEYALKHEQILEIGPEKGPMYKVGLKAPTAASPDGVHLEKVFRDYPFARAGVRDGDVVVEFAHRKVQTLRDIWIPYIEFQRGTQVPLQIRRGNATLNLLLTVE